MACCARPRPLPLNQFDLSSKNPLRNSLAGTAPLKVVLYCPLLPLVQYTFTVTPLKAGSPLTFNSTSPSNVAFTGLQPATQVSRLCWLAAWLGSWLARWPAGLWAMR